MSNLPAVISKNDSSAVYSYGLLNVAALTSLSLTLLLPMPMAQVAAIGVSLGAIYGAVLAVCEQDIVAILALLGLGALAGISTWALPLFAFWAYFLLFQVSYLVAGVSSLVALKSAGKSIPLLPLPRENR